MSMSYFILSAFFASLSIYNNSELLELLLCILYVILKISEKMKPQDVQIYWQIISIVYLNKLCKALNIDIYF